MCIFSMRAASRVLLFVFANFLTALTLIAGPISAQATTLPDPVVSCGSQVTITAPQIVTGTNPLCSTDSSDLNQTANTPTVSIPAVTASATAIVSNGAPGVFADSNVTKASPANLTAGGNAQLTYYVSVLVGNTPTTALIGVPGEPVIVGGKVNGSITVSCSQSDCNGDVVLGEFQLVNVTNPNVPVTVLQKAFNDSTSNPIGPSLAISPTDVDFIVGDVFAVTLTANVFGGSCPVGQTCDAFAQVDPTFSIDPSDPNAGNVQLVFSDGIINSGDDVTTTPLPATLPLLATGFAGLGLLGWRRKRKNAAALPQWGVKSAGQSSCPRE
jgi:hypothetical protein